MKSYVLLDYRVVDYSVALVITTDFDSVDEAYVMWFNPPTRANSLAETGWPSRRGFFANSGVT
jgi:hypothetical protein